MRNVKSKLWRVSFEYVRVSGVEIKPDIVGMLKEKQWQVRH
jgi:Holliday junction resolvase